MQNGSSRNVITPLKMALEQQQTIGSLTRVNVNFDFSLITNKIKNIFQKEV